jgi:8-oxo-dGTP pyrophosphatase MutT (NUDIX family)
MAHIHEKIDFTASVFIVHENKVLLHFHKKHGKWLQPGGHIELDEDPNQAALREAKEESGFDVELIGGERLSALSNDRSDIVPPKFLNRHNFNETHEHVDSVYFGRVIGGTLAPEEGVDMRWFSAAELDTIDLPPNVRVYALAALDALAT